MIAWLDWCTVYCTYDVSAGMVLWTEKMLFESSSYMVVIWFSYCSDNWSIHLYSSLSESSIHYSRWTEIQWGCTAQCAFCKVRCHCIFYGPGIRYSGIFCVPCISSGYSDIFWHISVVDTVAYFGGNHGSRVWKSLKLKKVYFPRTRTSWDKYMLNRIVFFQI